mgnify:FL=1
MKTINGQPVSEAQIDRWVTEAENGYDVETLRRRGLEERNLKMEVRRSATKHGIEPRSVTTR